MKNTLEKLEKLINRTTASLEDINTVNNAYQSWSRQLDELKSSRLDLTLTQYFELRDNVKLCTGGDNHPDTIDLLVMLNLSDNSLIMFPASVFINEKLGTSLVRLATVNANNVKLADIDLSLEMVCKFVSQIEQQFKSNCLQLETEINKAQDMSDIVTYLWEHDVNEWFPSKYYLSFLDDINIKNNDWHFHGSWLYILNPATASLNSLLSEFCLVNEHDVSIHGCHKFTKTNLTDVLNFFNQYHLLDWLNEQKKKYPHIFKDYSDALLVANFYDNFWSLLVQFNNGDKQLENHNITKTGWLNLKDFRELMSKNDTGIKNGLRCFNRFVQQFNPAQLSKRICSQNILSMINVDDDKIVKELDKTALCSNIRITMKQFDKLLVEKPEVITYNYLIIDDVTTKEFDNLLKSMYLLNHSLYRLLRIKFRAGEIKVQSSNDAAQQISLL